jgi:hypothetical protein
MTQKKFWRQIIMKKFIVSVLCTAVFFIGLGSLIEKTSAKFKSDEKALALIAAARQAIGGDANIKNVRGMTIVGNSTHTFEFDGATRNEQGGVEINFEFPNKFGRMVRIGNADGKTGVAEFHQEMDVIVTRKDGTPGELKELGDGKKEVFIFKKDGSSEAEDVKVDGNKRIIVKKDDGTVEELKSGDKNVVILERKPGDDNIKWKTEDGKAATFEKERIPFTAVRQNEMFRTTFALLLSAPDGTEAEYLYAGEGTVDGDAVDIIDVQSGGSSFKLYLDKSTHLPRMLSYMGMPVMKAVKLERQPGVAPKDDVILERKIHKAELVEHQVKFSDFRNVGGIQLPHRWTQTVAGNPGETIEISGYDINPANISEKFKNQKVFVRTKKAEQ